jgi:hypothetical protein
MRPLTVAFGIVILIAGVSTSIWSARYAPWVPQQRVAENPVVRRLREVKEGADRRAGLLSKTSADAARNSDPTVDPRPPIADKAPFPKAVIGGNDYVFGRMAINEEKKHKFRIENKGLAPLLLAKGPTECKCTISSLSDHAVAPGGFADIEITWKPREADSAFEKMAIIWTNDPKLSEIHFSVSGKVAPPLEVSPRAWNAGNVTEDQDGKAVGTIASELGGKFKIVSVVPADPNVAVHYEPMSERDLTRAKLNAGYEFTVSVGKGVRLGRFRSRIKVLTSLPGTDPVEIELTAVRSGPIRFLPAVPIVGFGYWDSEKLLLNMGRFRHENGSKTALPALVYAMKDKFQLLGIKSSDSFVKVSLEPNPAISNGAQQGVRFVFEVPPGSPPVNYMTRKPVHVTVNTNHPQLKDLDFDLQFVSR